MVRSFLEPAAFGRPTPASVASGAAGYDLSIMRIELDLAPGVHRIEHAYTNCYVIADDDGVTLVDAGFPSTGQAVIDCLAAHRPAADRHQGPAADPRALRPRRLRPRAARVPRGAGLGAPGRPAAGRAPLPVPAAAEPVRLPARAIRRSWPILGAMTAAGALTVRGVDADQTYADDEVHRRARPAAGRAHARAHLGPVGVPPARARRPAQPATRWSPSTPTPASAGPGWSRPPPRPTPGRRTPALDRIVGPGRPPGAVGPW